MICLLCLIFMGLDNVINIIGMIWLVLYEEVVLIDYKKFKIVGILVEIVDC